jgi:hypothetical protein
MFQHLHHLSQLNSSTSVRRRFRRQTSPRGKTRRALLFSRFVTRLATPFLRVVAVCFAFREFRFSSPQLEAWAIPAEGPTVVGVTIKPPSDFLREHNDRGACQELK